GRARARARGRARLQRPDGQERPGLRRRAARDRDLPLAGGVPALAVGVRGGGAARRGDVPQPPAASGGRAVLTALARLGPVGRMAGLIVALLVIASLGLAAIRRVRPGLDLTEVAARVRSWW